MHIAVLSDPRNFHTRKWALALQRAGAEVTVFSFETYSGNDLRSVRIKPPFAKGNSYSYLAYLLGGGRLRRALRRHKIDVVCALNVTPFGVWARRSGVHPLVSIALGADILEYPPDLKLAPELAERSWDAEHTQGGWLAKQKRKFFRKQVKKTLAKSDLLIADNSWLITRMNDWFDVPPGHANLLRWGVEPELFEVPESQLDSLRRKWGISGQQKVVLSPRGVKAVYQGDIILAAFEQLLEQGDKDVFYLMLSAGYGVPPAIEKKARELEERYPHFRFVREVLPREEVYALWNLTDVFVSAPVYDGYSAALAEGRYIGAVPVVNAIPSNEEMITHGENGWITEPFTAEQLATDLHLILSDLPNWKEKFRLPNREWIEEHSLMQGNAEVFLEWAKQLKKS